MSPYIVFVTARKDIAFLLCIFAFYRVSNNKVNTAFWDLRICFSPPLVLVFKRKSINPEWVNDDLT